MLQKIQKQLNKQIRIAGFMALRYKGRSDKRGSWIYRQFKAKYKYLINIKYKLEDKENKKQKELINF